jgi:hypothetical protein
MEPLPGCRISPAPAVDALPAPVEEVHDVAPTTPAPALSAATACTNRRRPIPRAIVSAACSASARLLLFIKGAFPDPISELLPARNDFSTPDRRYRRSVV